MSNHNQAPSPKADYVPPVELFGPEGVFTEFSGNEIATFGEYPAMALEDVVKLCGEHWVPLALNDKEQGLTLLRSLIA